ncbi:type 4b pilus protein PilO2 [Burkholderia gladioli]|uniref:type 4b pilus protein PilO2 n=1 Tax=Burkholderia gladioli TaxID=28095 RepID=UPI00163F1373|nr:type 4b pilus protein PilO2 [Burkholderia gladioli]
MIELISLPGSVVRYAIGLSWRADGEPPRGRTLRQLAKERGRYGVIDDADMDFQMGLGHLPPGAKLGSTFSLGKRAGLQPLALAIAQQHKRPWLGLFDLGDGQHWLVGVRGHRQIMPGSDRVGTHAEMTAVRDAMISAESWNMVEGTRETLAQWAAQADPAPALRDLTVTLTPWAIGMYAVSSVMATYLAVMWWPATWWPHHPAPAPVAVQPWTQMPLPSAMVAACRDAWSKPSITRLAERGWKLVQWSCEANGTSLSLTLDWQSAGGLADAAPGSLTDATHSRELISIPTSLAPSSAPPAAPDTARRAMWSLVQTQGWGMSLQDAYAVLPNAGPGNSTPRKSAPNQPTWRALSLSLSMAASPWHVAGPGFERVAGLRLASMTWSEQTSLTPWSMKGTLYTQAGGGL